MVAMNKAIVEVFYFFNFIFRTLFVAIAVD